MPPVKRYIISKKLLLSHKGKKRKEIVTALKCGYNKLNESIIHHGLEAEFEMRTNTPRTSDYVIPSLHITEAQIAPYYDKTMSIAAKGLGCEYNKFVSGVKRKGLFHNFTCNVGKDEKVFCPICRKNEVAYKYKMCEPCKPAAWYH